MIELINVWGRAWADFFGPALLQNTVFLCLIFAAMTLLKNAPARIRYSVGLIGLFKLILPPLLPLRIPTVTETIIPPDILPAGAASTPVVSGEPVIAVSSPMPIEPLGAVLIIYSLVALILILISGLNTYRLRAQLKSAEPITGLNWNPMFPSPEVSLYRTEKVPMPLTWGLFPKRIYLPKE